MPSSSSRPPPGQPAAANDVVPAAITFAALGLDISQAEVTACFLLPDGSELVPRWTLPNSLPGAQALAERVHTLAKAQGIKELRMGLEATGLYWWHLACFLKEMPVLTEVHPTIYVFNPAWVQGLKRVYADAGKTDRLDAFFIAERLRVGRLPTPFQPDLVYAPEAPADEVPCASGPEARTRQELLPGLALLALQRLSPRSALRRFVSPHQSGHSGDLHHRGVGASPPWKSWRPLSTSTAGGGLLIRAWSPRPASLQLVTPTGLRQGSMSRSS